jgi:hypothetical protein
MSKYDPVFGHHNRWTWNPFRSVTKNGNQSKQETPGDSADPESDKRETSDQDESYHKRITKYNCPVEPFRETLRILDELF